MATARLVCQREETPDKDCMLRDNDATTLQCWKCREGEIWNDEAKRCDRVTIAGCVSYGHDLECVECDEQHFEDGGKCVELSLFQEKVIANCRLHAWKERNILFECTECLPDFILTLEGSCEMRSTGIDYCLVYKSAIECMVCVEGKVAAIAYAGQDSIEVLGSMCVENTDDVIPNCKLQQSLKFCFECQPDFLLSALKTRCLQHCLSADQDSEKCAVCRPGFGQLEETGECVALTTVIDNCAATIAVESAPGVYAAIDCHLCEPNFEVKHIEQSTVCARIENNKYKHCVVSPRQSMSCSFCEKGYYPKLSEHLDNHFACEPLPHYDLPEADPLRYCEIANSATDCALCQIDSFMNSDRQCVHNSEPPVICDCFGGLAHVYGY